MVDLSAPDTVRFVAPAPDLPLITLGPYATVVDLFGAFREVFGPPPMYPLWSLGYQQVGGCVFMCWKKAGKLVWLVPTTVRSPVVSIEGVHARRPVLFLLSARV